MIEGSRRILKRVRKSLLELKRDRRSLRLSSCASKCFRIWIESNNLKLWMQPLQQNGQRAGAAADIENALARPQFGLIEQGSPHLIGAHPLRHYIVERQKTVLARSRNVSS